MFAHIDADAFFASVLVRKRPHLMGQPLLALGMGGSCVIAASYEAKAFGVKTGMPLTEARKLVPKAIAIPSDFEEACVASRELERLLEDQCPRMERASVDEWYADLHTCTGGIPKNLHQWANEIQIQAKTGVHLTVSVGIAPTKLLAKMASEYRKPAGCTILGTNLSVKDFLCDRPAAAIPGIGRRRHVHADAHGWKTAWHIATASPEALLRLFGAPGSEMQQELLGNPIHFIADSKALPKSLSRCRSFRTTRDCNIVRAQILSHLSRLVLRMRLQNLTCTGVQAWVRSKDMKHYGADWRLPQAVRTEEELLPYVRSCTERCIRQCSSYTQAGLSLHGLTLRGAKQYSLFEAVEQAEASEAMQQTLDDVRQKFGREVVVRGSSLSAASGAKRERPTVYGGVGFCR